MDYATQPIAFTRPRIVLDLADRFLLNDVRALDGDPWDLSSETDLEAFREFLLDVRRTLPVYLVTNVGLGADYALISAGELATAVRCMAHVATMSARVTYDWTKMVGKAWSAYQGAVRTYGPNLSFEDDAPHSHRLALPGTILGFSHRGLAGADAFEQFLLEQAHAHSAFMRTDPAPCLFYADAVRRKSALALETARENADWHALYDEDIEALKKKIEELEGQAEEYNDDAIATSRERDQYSEENRRLRHHNEALRAALAARMDKPVDEAIQSPEAYEDLPEWASTYLPGRLVFHPRASKELKDALYDDLEHVIRALLLLANEYRNMRMGVGGAKAAFDDGLARLGLRNGPSISEHGAGEQGRTYFVQYPLGSGEWRFLELHLRNKANSRDPRRCLGIYFFWDDDRQEVVVGSLPGHLETRQT